MFGLFKAKERVVAATEKEKLTTTVMILWGRSDVRSRFYTLLMLGMYGDRSGVTGSDQRDIVAKLVHFKYLNSAESFARWLDENDDSNVEDYLAIYRQDQRDPDMFHWKAKSLEFYVPEDLYRSTKKSVEEQIMSWLKEGKITTKDLM